MLLMLLFSALSLAISPKPIQDGGQEPRYDMKVRQLVFLITPEKPAAEKLTQDQATELQAEHLRFLERLWKERKILLVGPLEDAGRRRGLILLDVEEQDAARALLKDDPLIKGGRLDLELHSWFVARNVPQMGPKFFDLEQLWFGMLMRPDHAPELSAEQAQEVQQGHMAHIERMAREGSLLLAGPMTADTPFRGVFIFRGEKAHVESLAAQDPAIKAGRLELKLLKWYTAKGVFPDKRTQ